MISQNYALVPLLALAAALANSPSNLQSLRDAAPDAAGVVYTQGGAGGTSQLMVVDWSGRTRVVSQGFHSASDPAVSFDGKRILFAGRRQSSDRWQIFELNLDGGEARQITREAQDCRQPIYQSRVFSLAVEEPWYQVAFVSGGSLYSAKLDGSMVQRLTYAGGDNQDPMVAPDGRMIYASQGRLFGVNLDGTDYEQFAQYAGLAQRMACPTTKRQMVFVEGSGQLAVVSLDRPLRTRRVLTTAADGVFQSPAALPNGEVLVSRRGGGRSELWRLDPETGKRGLVWADAGGDVLQPQLIAAREEPAGRGSVVDPKEPTAMLYCLSVYTGDLPRLMPKGSAKRVRILKGPASAPVKLGEVEVEEDGSFQVQLPANEAVKVQVLGAAGQVMRSSAWFWMRNRENRGCVGCHEDRELAPENREAQALLKKALNLAHGAGGSR
jgi:hypothetical protein